MSTHTSFLTMLLAVLFVGLPFETRASGGDQAGRPGSDIQTGAPALNRELAARVIASRPAPDPAMQRRTVAMPSVKIAVKQEGMYRVTRVELEAAGFPVNSDSTTWRLFMNGNEQAIIVGDGNQYIDFYGRGIDTAETDTRYYYLIQDIVPGKRINSKILNSIGGNVVSNSYRYNIIKKERLWYVPDILNGPAENYFGNFTSPDLPLNENFTLTGVDTQGLDAVVKVDMQGFLNGPHQPLVSLNGTAIGVLSGGTGKEHFSGTFAVPAALLVEGMNGLAIGVELGYSFFDSVTVTYSKKYAATQDRISFATAPYRRALVTGFTSSNIRVFDTTFDGEPQLIANPQIVPNAGGYAVRMPSNRAALFYAVEDSGLLHSPGVTFNAPSTLASPDNDAGMVIISYSSLMAGAESWANYRRSADGGAFNVKVVDIEDVFDEFSYGTHSADAIHDLLSYAHTHWQHGGPSYVLLLGDASYDRRNYEGYGYWDLVPSKDVDLTFQEAGSDDAMADLDADGIADIPIGRIPARTGADITAALNKTIAFETAANQSLHRGALLAYESLVGYPYKDMSRHFAEQLPPDIPVTFIPHNIPPSNLSEPLSGQQNLIDAINEGHYVVNYAGPASSGVWAALNFFSISDVPLLTNAARPSIITAPGNYSALFMLPAQETLGEALVKAPNGGAAALWGSQTITSPDPQEVIGTEFYRLIGTGNESRIGDVIRSAKAPIAGTSLGYSWELFGDPALKVR